MKASGVIGALVVLAGLAAITPFFQRPASLPPSVGLGTYQVAVAALVGVVALCLLVVASETSVFWSEFLRPPSYRHGALQSLKFAALALAGEGILFVGMVAIGFPSFWTNTAPGPVVLAMEQVLHGLTALVAVAGGVLIGRAVLLLGRALTGGRAT